ncbi:MAG: thioesterase family protein [Ignavibacteriaceae bacterium]
MYSVFETEIFIRPDDIDPNNHVHNSKYLDYVQAARYDQMINSYKMSMEEFHKQGYNWVATTAHIEFKRALKLGDKIVVKTQLKSYNGAQVTVNFWILKKDKNKISAEGFLVYTMISLRSGKPVRIPDEIIERYSV